jgi:hypothetical protein
MASRQVVLACIESSYGTAKSTPALGTDMAYLRLPTDDAFTAEMVPLINLVPHGGGLNVPGDAVAEAYALAGELVTPLYPGIWTTLLMGAAGIPINSGRTAPWTTTDASAVMPVGDLASLSFYEYMLFPAQTTERNRHAGCKFSRWSLSCSEQQRALIFRGSFLGIRSIGNAQESTTDPDATEFPLYTEGDLPTGHYHFGHMASGTGTIKIGSARVKIESLTASCENYLDPKRYASSYLQTCEFVGRQLTVQAVVKLESMTDRDAFRALTAQDCEFKWDNGSHTLKVDMHDANIITSYKRQFSSRQPNKAALTVTSKWSTAQAADFGITLT